MSKPVRPIRQVIWSAASGASTVAERLRARPWGSAVTRAAAAPSAKDQKGEHLLEIRGLLQMQRAELEADHQDPGIRLRANHVAREPERIDGGIAAHEADAGPLDPRAQGEPVDQVEVETRCREARAGHHDEVSDAFEVVLQVDRRPEREIAGALLVDPHAGARVREGAVTVEPGIVELPGPVAAREDRVAAVNAAALRHPPEQPAGAGIA
jgi:hypothetical protein